MGPPTKSEFVEGAIVGHDALPNVWDEAREGKSNDVAYPCILGDNLEQQDVGDLRLRRGIFWTDLGSGVSREGRPNSALG